MKRAIGIFLKGILIGFISIAIPGLSASTIAIALGLYFLLIDSISSIFSNFKKSIAFLIPIMLGFGVGSILGATLVSKLYDKYPLPVTALIIGFVIGSIPEMFREIRETKAKKRNFIITLIVMAGNFYKMLNDNICEIGSDLTFERGVGAPSILFKNVAISGE